MAAGDALSKHYASLTAAERFALMVEAMARKDDAEADRLEDSCPRLLYRQEDAEFRDRMRRAFTIAMLACLNMREGLAQLRMARRFAEHHVLFAEGPTRVAEAAFLYGRAYGKWEVGAIGDVDVPEREALAAEVEGNEDLRRQLDEVRECAGLGMEQVADTLRRATGEVHAADLIAQWEGFGRFCLESLGVEAHMVLAAFGLRQCDVAGEVLGDDPPATADEGASATWEGHWARIWVGRFGQARWTPTTRGASNATRGSPDIAADLSCRHTFRATGITAYLQNGSTIEKARAIAASESPRTSKLYDRTYDTLTLDEVDRIAI